MPKGCISCHQVACEAKAPQIAHLLVGPITRKHSLSPAPSLVCLTELTRDHACTGDGMQQASLFSLCHPCMQPWVRQGVGKEELGLLALAACLNRERVNSPSAVLSLPQYCGQYCLHMELLHG